MGNDLTSIGLIIAAAAIIVTFILWIRRPEPVLLDHDEPGPLDALLTPVEHHGADEGWSPAADVRDSGDPFTRGLSEIELREPLLFDEIAAAYPVRLDWQPPDFTSEWETLGTVLDQLGATQPLPRIEVAAA